MSESALAVFLIARTDTVSDLESYRRAFVFFEEQNLEAVIEHELTDVSRASNACDEEQRRERRNQGKKNPIHNRFKVKQAAPKSRELPASLTHD
jgi:hypothetical protein